MDYKKNEGGVRMIYDATTGYIITPAGIGKYVGFDPTTGKVTVEIDSMYLVEFDGDRCFPLREEG